MLDFLNEGGAAMWVILAFSVIAIAIMLERFYVLHFSYAHRANFFNAVIRHVKKRDFSTAQVLCHGTAHPLAKILAVVLSGNFQTKEALESALAISTQKIIPNIQKRTHLLQMLGSTSTLIGLLGTIQGLIISFTSLAGANAAAKAELLAKGISTAMNTTAFGLIVAILCIVGHTILSNLESGILQKYDETISEVVHVILHGNKVQAPNGQQRAG